MALAKPICLFPYVATFFLISLHFSLLQASFNPDSEPLLQFKTLSDTDNKLSDWNSSTDPCTWTGIACLNNRVSRLVLENLNLQGSSLQPLISLTQLRVLSLKRNNLSGPIPQNISNLSALKLLFISHNHFLWLEENQFTGSISSLNLPSLQDFNVSSNRVSGEIPKSLSGFPASAFAQNLPAGLCGPPLQACKGVASDPTRPGSDGAIASPLLPGTNPTGTVSSTPSSVVAPNKPTNTNHKISKTSTKISPLALIAIILGDILILAVVSLLLYCYFWRNYAAKMRNGKGSKLLETEKIVYSSSPYPNQPGFERGRMVFFEGVERFELEDLLRASAEMLGKGGFGTAYKAVLDDGNVVAVKRLKDANVGGKRELEQHMERIQDRKLISLVPSYTPSPLKNREAKLDPWPFCSWLTLESSNRGPGRTPLDWTTRLKIAAGAARGIAYMHNSCKALKLVHGNIKSTNILLDKSGNARVSDFGLSLFASSANYAPRSSGYRAPEATSDGRKQTQKSDVYSFGVLLLEILTGKCPSVVDCGGGPGNGYDGPIDLPRWVQSVVREEWTAEVFDLELMRYKDIEEEMVGLLQIALACTTPSPDQRPRMGHVVKMIEEIRGELSPCHDTFDYVSDSPCLSEDTCGVSQ
ncbi:hypothetical protein OIU77_014162 [Salix suchowensis]|uniref:Protein kinase domain-containing protein n=1 Tax=Salix suchowensis TaxID=1278906 RepID=A0ABQ8ZWF6_9ROSI|nr:hypothetical protein OIU77_014162 [Salix suchowensis]